MAPAARREATRKNGTTTGKNVRIYEHKVSLTEHLVQNDPQFQAVYDAVLVQAAIFVIYVLVHDFWIAGSPTIGLKHFVTVVVGNGYSFFCFVCLECYLLLSALAVHPVFLSWVWCHRRGPPVLVGLLYLGLCASQMVVSSLVVFWTVFASPLTNFTALIAGIEQIRLLMKSYSFIRENAYKVLYPWNKDDEEGPAVWYAGQMEPHVGSFSTYLYFLFCPTLLYRDKYPRTPRVRPIRVAAHLLKCCISLTFVVVLCKEVFDSYPEITNSHPTNFNTQVFLLTFLTCTLWGLVLQFMAGYFFLHSWLNLWGEVLQFADREFYSDWWTCTSFSAFYRKWNLVVHDWIKAYIYQDMKDLFHRGWYNKIASLPTIIISAIFHEYVLWAPVRFVLPLLLTMFGIFGSVLYFVRPNGKTNFWNYFLHFGLQLGVSIMLFVYATEFYARKTCIKEETFINTFIPRFYTCFSSSSSPSVLSQDADT